MHTLYPLIEMRSLIALIVGYLLLPKEMCALQTCSMGTRKFRIIKDLLESSIHCRKVELYFSEQASMKVWIQPTLVVAIDCR